eukprot:3544096-Prymnesium_polylepis.2
MSRLPHPQKISCCHTQCRRPPPGAGRGNQTWSIWWTRMETSVAHRGAAVAKASAVSCSGTCAAHRRH